MDLEQHFVRPEFLDGLLPTPGFAGRHVVEFGAGRGALTRVLLAAGAASVEAWEIDPGLPAPFPDARLSWLARDILTATPATVAGRAVAAFPPYATLPFLLELCREIPDLVLMAPPKRLDACLDMGMRVLGELDGEAFEPVSTGRHLVLARGWDMASRIPGR